MKEVRSWQPEEDVWTYGWFIPDSGKQPTREWINYGFHVSKETTNEQNSLREILYHLWVSTVVVHTFSNLVPLQTRSHLHLLQDDLNVSLTQTFVIPTVSI